MKTFIFQLEGKTGFHRVALFSYSPLSLRHAVTFPAMRSFYYIHGELLLKKYLGARRMCALLSNAWICNEILNQDEPQSEHDHLCVLIKFLTDKVHVNYASM